MYTVCPQYGFRTGEKGITVSCPFIMSNEEKCGMNVNMYPCTTLLCLKFNGIPSLIEETSLSMTLAK